jgi:hypothetical protein
MLQNKTTKSLNKEYTIINRIRPNGSIKESLNPKFMLFICIKCIEWIDKFVLLTSVILFYGNNGRSIVGKR